MTHQRRKEIASGGAGGADHDVAKGLLRKVAFGNISRQCKHALDLATGIEDRTDNHVPPLRRAIDSGFEIACEVTGTALQGSVQSGGGSGAVFTLPKINPGSMQNRANITDFQRLGSAFVYKKQTSLKIEDLDAVGATGDQALIEALKRFQPLTLVGRYGWSHSLVEKAALLVAM